MVRLDSTVTAALMHEPSDSSLLVGRGAGDGAPAAGGERRWSAGRGSAWRDHRRAAKKRARDIQFTRGRPRRVQLYRELIRTTRATLAYLQQAAAQLATTADWAVALWQAKVDHYRPLIERIIAQTERRVLAGEPVPAGDKLVSLFEPHADIIRKGREVAYGHKLNLTTGQSGLILDLVIEAGNPADSERLLPMLERHIALYGQPPRQAAADGSYASRDNLRQAKARGVRDMAFHKKGGLRHRGHGQEPLGLSQAQELPRRHRGRHLVPQAGLRSGPLHLARARPLPGLRLVRGGGLQPRPLRPPQADLRPTAAGTKRRPANAGRAAPLAPCRPLRCPRRSRAPRQPRAPHKTSTHRAGQAR